MAAGQALFAGSPGRLCRVGSPGDGREAEGRGRGSCSQEQAGFLPWRLHIVSVSEWSGGCHHLGARFLEAACLKD